MRHIIENLKNKYYDYVIALKNKYYNYVIALKHNSPTMTFKLYWKITFHGKRSRRNTWSLTCFYTKHSCAHDVALYVSLDVVFSRFKRFRVIIMYRLNAAFLMTVRETCRVHFHTSTTPCTASCHGFAF